MSRRVAADFAVGCAMWAGILLYCTPDKLQEKS